MNKIDNQDMFGMVLWIYASMELEDGNTEKAKEYFDRVWKGQNESRLKELRDLCKGIQEEIDSERKIMDETHTNRDLFHWLKNRAHDNLFTEDGKRLQRKNDLDVLFKDAQRLNKHVHNEIKKIVTHSGTKSKFDFVSGPIKRPQRAIEKIVRRYHRQPRYLTDIVRCRVYVEDLESIVQFVQNLRSNSTLNICFLKNRIDDDYDAKESFGFRDLQLNLEAGWSNGKIVPKENWESESARTHVCEVQVMLKSFRDIVERTAWDSRYEVLRNLAGK